MRKEKVLFEETSGLWGEEQGKRNKISGNCWTERKLRGNSTRILFTLREEGSSLLHSSDGWNKKKPNTKLLQMHKEKLSAARLEKPWDRLPGK